MHLRGIVGFVFVLLMSGCAGLRTPPPGAPPPSSPPQGGAEVVAAVPTSPSPPSAPSSAVATPAGAGAGEPVRVSAAPATTTRSTTAPSTAAPSTAAPSTAAPSTPAPSTTTRSTTASSTAAPSTPTPSGQTAGTTAPLVAKAPAKTPASPAPAAQPSRKESAPPDIASPSAPPLDLTSLEKRLKDTKAIGLMTKITLKNQVNDLLDQFRAFYQGKIKTDLANLRRSYDLLVLKVLSLLQDGDHALSTAIASSREAIWGILADPAKFATI